MKMEDLTKTQIVLLTLLVSFVTSIATGIVTVTLVDQAPPGITQTINRVVERTVEKVVPGQEASVITKETTVVVKEEDLVIEAVDKNRRNVVVLKTEEGTKVGIGFLVSQDGFIATDSSLAIPGMTAVLSNQKEYSLKILKDDEELGLALFKIVPPKDSPEDLKFSRASFGEADSLKLGQTVVALGGLAERSVSTGIISRIETIDVEKESAINPKDEETETIIEKVVFSISTNISVSDEYKGSPLLDIDGLVVGVNIKKGTTGVALPSNVILEMINAVRTELDTKTTTSS